MSGNMDVMSVSDDDLDKVPDQPAVQESPEPAPEAEPEAHVETAPDEVQEPAGDAEPELQEEGDPTPEPVTPDPTATTPSPVVPAPEVKPPVPVITPAAKPDDKTAPKPSENEQDYKAFYEKVMAPIKAGGKSIQVRSVDEAISLMQKGLDYTRKTQDLAKDKKFIMMLGQAGLLDETKLDLIIGVSKNDPEAIKRLLKEAKIDPVDIDMSQEDKYQSGAHVVGDSTAKLQSVIDDMNADDEGQETLRVIKAWDSASRQVFGEHPELLEFVHKQRLDGTFAKVSAEVEHRRALGQIPAGVPFFYAYKNVGEELKAKGHLEPISSVAPKAPAPTVGTAPAPVVIRRPASPSSSVAPGKSAVRAAAPTRTSPKAVHTAPNIMAMSDDDLAKLP